jgi:2,4-dienoyl-CoA reductase-like NADH-dependent reductase (Old Yellow Enzyme family)
MEEEKMSRLFESSEINGMKLANRFVRSATWEGMATDDGACTERLITLMAQLAQGKVGLIITSHAYIMPEGQAGPWQIGVYKDDLIEGLRNMTSAVHSNGGRVVLQMAHAGYFANSELTAQMPSALSQVEGFSKSPCKVMGVGEIQEVVEAFRQAARRGKDAGFDGVQIHAAHGYLLSQSLSPSFNKRTDAYGGPVENRARLLMEVLHEVRSTVGPNFPVLVKMNCQDFVNGGLSLDDSLQVGEMLEQGGIDAIELSGGTFVSGKLNPSRRGIDSEDKEAYFRDEARAFKERLDVPLILVGGMRSFHLVEKLVEEGYADYISMSRPFIREPNLVKRWESGDLSKATCVSDSKCFGPIMAGEGMYCVVEKRQKEER